ncbi:unnamed protein product [Pleuronectes platessa]|uniref:Uncharacterized protein n=1 Tax=Pleuronectes platessa TaxID=8262 RepID=A0A9N7VE64_PLEPL|nr:unnamed protein product [Pleuronectes platessa]
MPLTNIEQQVPGSLSAEGRDGWRVGVELRAPNYSPGSHSLHASPSAPMFGCIFPGTDDVLSPALRSQEGSTSAQSAALSD